MAPHRDGALLRRVLGLGLVLSSALALTQTERLGAQTPLPSSTLAETGPAYSVVHTAPSEFNRRVYVVDEGGLRSMRFGSIDGVDQTRIRRGYPQELPMPYLRSAAVGLVIPDDLQRVLVIGLGGGALPSFVQATFPEVSVDAVDIDPVVARVAQEYFDLKVTEQLQVHVLDAVDYVKGNQRRYDYILLDAYDADDLPAALATRSFFRDVKALLRAENGVVVVNIAIKGVLRTDAMVRTLTDLFAHCLHMRSNPSLNDVLLLSDRELPVGDSLTDRLLRLPPDQELQSSIRSHAEASQPCDG